MNTLGARSRLVLAIDFGLSGNSAKYLGRGWSSPEQDFCWTVGSESHLQLPQLESSAEYVLEVSVDPLLLPSRVTQQRLTVLLNGAEVGSTALTHGRRIALRLPAALILQHTEASLTFNHPDAARPSEVGIPDSRQLAICFRQLKLWQIDSGAMSRTIPGQGGITALDAERLTGRTPAELMLQFESVGDNCEFGLVQRRCGAEPIGLFRFSNIELTKLLTGIECGFCDLGLPANVELKLEDTERPEYIMTERHYGLVYHTFRYKGEVDAPKLLANEPARLVFLARKFMDDVRDARKIFVCKRYANVTDEEMLLLHTTLGRHGRSALLYVVSADQAHPPGTVEMKMHGLLKGYVSRFAPNENAHDLVLEEWLEVCAHAALLTGAQRVPVLKSTI
jgi:hypothetical protein